MPAGRYRHRITLQNATITRDEYGGVIRTWRDLDTVWAAVDTLKGDEYFTARTLRNAVSYRVTLRYRSDLTPHHRLLFEGRTFDIEAVLPDSRKTRLVLMCSELV